MDDSDIKPARPSRGSSVEQPTAEAKAAEKQARKPSESFVAPKVKDNRPERVIVRHPIQTSGMPPLAKGAFHTGQQDVMGNSIKIRRNEGPVEVRFTKLIEEAINEGKIERLD